MFYHVNTLLTLSFASPVGWARSAGLTGGEENGGVRCFFFPGQTLSDSCHQEKASRFLVLVSVVHIAEVRLVLKHTIELISCSPTLSPPVARPLAGHYLVGHQNPLVAGYSPPSSGGPLRWPHTLLALIFLLLFGHSLSRSRRGLSASNSPTSSGRSS